MCKPDNGCLPLGCIPGLAVVWSSYCMIYLQQIELHILRTADQEGPWKVTVCLESHSIIRLLVCRSSE